MSLFDCVNRIIRDPDAQSEMMPKSRLGKKQIQARIKELEEKGYSTGDAERIVAEKMAEELRTRGERAQTMWREISDRYETQGHPKHIAEVLAAEDVKAAFKLEAGEKRHRFLSVISDQRKAQAEVKAAKGKPYLRDRVERLQYEVDGWVRLAYSRIDDYIGEHNLDLLNRLKGKARSMNVYREMRGESTGDESAKLLADAIVKVREEFRLMLNERGANIGKLDDYGTSQKHNRRVISDTPFAQWAADLKNEIDWRKVDDPLTGLPMQRGDAPPPDSAQMSYLRETYDNITYKKESQEAVYGKPQGQALYKQLSENRKLHFKSADAWARYNKKYGTMSPHEAILSDLRSMAEDLAAMDAFGPNPYLGLNYRAQLLEKAGRDMGLTGKAFQALEGDGATAARIFKVVRNSMAPETRGQADVAFYGSTLRKVLQSAYLDRAVVASLSDTNTMRMAAKMIGANQANIIARQVGLARSLSKDDLKRLRWVVDTQADPGAASSRFSQEVMPARWADMLVNMSMRIQGLAAWTDRARRMWHETEWGQMAGSVGRPLRDVDENLRGRLKAAGVSDEDWANFSDPKNLFTAEDGSTFLVPQYFLEVTDLPRDKAWPIAAKIQTMIETDMERAVPTSSPVARAWLGEGNDAPAGSFEFETRKSVASMKSFILSFSRNQYLAIKSIPTSAGRLGYAANLLVGATVMGGISLQLGHLIAGRDPEPMDTGDFVGRAMMKGGGLGIMGDLVVNGQTAWGGGLASYTLGPVYSFGADAGTLVFGNVQELTRQVLNGEPIDTNLIAETRRFLGRNTPMADTPLAGPLIQRAFFDQLWMAFDPEAMNDMRRSMKAAENRNDAGFYWMQGSPLPERAPNLRNALGQ